MKATITTLNIISKYSVQSPKQFAYLYFGRDHAGWKRSGPCGRNKSGVQKGQGLMLWAGGWLGKMNKKGLITHSRPYRLTPEGEDLLSKNKDNGALQ